ncbi:hypothetical protein ABEB36_014751 [Hypothenemus hampei]|uniref:THAP-type domain-containing protein n=1 Tax=Hypothenemus hampei TaxID=57062 RepID=A0ABD1E306_HYPHA
MSIFKFPNDKDLRAEWLKATGRKGFVPSKYSSICEKHFREEDLIKLVVDRETGATDFPTRVQLKEGAIPTQHLKIQSKPVNNKKKLKIIAVPTLNLHGTEGISDRNVYMSSQEAFIPVHSSQNERNVVTEQTDSLEKKYKHLQLEFEILQDQSRSKKISSKSISIESRDEDDLKGLEDLSDRVEVVRNDGLHEKFLDLLDKYEELKNRHLSLGEEIENLEKVNALLKCKIFKV